MKTEPILFPVKVPYSTAPDVVKLKDAFNLTIITPDVLQYKKDQIALFDNDLYGCIDSDIVGECSEKISKFYSLPSVSSFQDLALSVNEDVAILSLGRVIAICFCSPSGFIPSHLLGKSFYEIHQPVPDAELLLKMSDKLGSLLSDINKGPHRRYVWTITANPSYNQHPSLKNKFQPKSISDLYFRTEVQTTIPLGNNVHALFSVKVEMNPLEVVWQDHEKKNTILASVNSMSDEMLLYKNLQLIKTILNQNS